MNRCKNITIKFFRQRDVNRLTLRAFINDALAQMVMSDVWFVFTEKEFKSLEKDQAMVSDAYHKCESYAPDELLFFDMYFCEEKYGTEGVRFYKMRFPLTARRAILRYGKRAWRKLDDAEDEAHRLGKDDYQEEISIEISEKRVEKWLRKE